jgi:hypothetical protein
VRILLDSNIWRYLVDADAIRLLREATNREKRTSIVISPAVLYEAAHNEDGVIRRKLLSAMTQRWWKRLMPEAFSEAEELKAEIRRLKPEWLRHRPDMNRFKRFRQDWCRSKGGIWDRIEEDSRLLRDDERESGLLLRAQVQARALREQGREMSAKWLSAPLNLTIGSLPSACDGWDGTPFELWRLAGYNALLSSLSTPGHATYDWMEGEVDLAALSGSSSALLHFWLHEVRTEIMPRHWLRWAFEFLQAQRRVTDGTPADCQLGTYLVDVDAFVTADKIFHSIATKCREDAPFPLAASHLLPAGVAAVEPLLDLVRMR